MLVRLKPSPLAHVISSGFLNVGRVSSHPGAALSPTADSASRLQPKSASTTRAHSTIARFVLPLGSGHTRPVASAVMLVALGLGVWCGGSPASRASATSSITSYRFANPSQGN